MRRTKLTEDDYLRILHLIQGANIHLEAALRGPTLAMFALLEMREGDVRAFDYPLDRHVDLLVNGELKYRGGMCAAGNKGGFRTHELVLEK